MEINIKTLSNFELNENILNLAKSERKITHQILLYINEIELRKLYLSEGYSSMFDYLVKKIGYCESAAYRRLSSARLLNELPEISSKVESGSLNLSQLSQVQTALRQEKKELKNKFGACQFSLRDKALEVICKLENQNQKQSAVIIAQEFDLPLAAQEKAKLQKDLSLKLELVFSDDEAKLLEKVKALTSHQNPEQSWKDLFLLLAKKELKKWEVKSGLDNSRSDKKGDSECLIDLNRNLKCSDEVEIIDSKNSSDIIESDLKFSIENNENNSKNILNSSDSDKKVIAIFQHEAAPLEKSEPKITLSLEPGAYENQKSKINSKDIQTKFEHKKNAQRKPISIKVKRKLFSVANFQCQHIDPLSQQRCAGTHFLQVDHKIPLAIGGSDEIQNLRVLCQAHNLLAARDWGLIKN